jgi:hypothetical protein
MKSSTTAFGVIGRKTGKRVKLHSRPGNDLTPRFPLIVEALGRLRPQSCIILRVARQHMRRPGRRNGLQARTKELHKDKERSMT